MTTESRRVVVTGASGHIGFHVARLLLQRSVQVTIVVRSINENVVELEDAGAIVRRCDVANPETWSDSLEGIDCLFHVAADNSVDRGRASAIIAGTVDLTRAVIDAAVQRRVPTIVYTSSVVVLGRSDRHDRLIGENDRTGTAESPYVEGKLAAERWCDELVAGNGVDLRRVYPSWVIGPADVKGTPPHRLVARLIRNPPLLAPSGGISITGVEAVAKGHINAWLRGERHGRYVLGGHNLTFCDLFARLAASAGTRPPLGVLPRAAVVTGAAVLTAVGKAFGRSLSPIDLAYARAVVGRFSWYDSTPAIADLGYQVPSLDGLLADAVVDARRRNAGLLQLGRRRVPHAAPFARDAEPPLLVTGVPGWLGNRFVDAFVDGLSQRSANPVLRLPTSRRVRLLVEPRLAGLLSLPRQFEIVPGSLADNDAVRRAVAGIGTVYHLAGAVTPGRRSVFYEVNAEGTRRLVDASIEAGVARFMLMSTDAIAGSGHPTARVFDEHTPDAPYGDYGRSKQAAERYLLQKTSEGRIKGTSLRGFWFFGRYAPARQRRFMAQAGRGRIPLVGGGKNFRSVSITDNTVAAFLLAENAPASVGKWYWIGDTRADYTLEELGRILAAATGADFRPARLPAVVGSLARAADAALAKAGVVLPLFHSLGKYDLDIAGDVAAARRDFGYEPIMSLAEFARDYYASLPDSV